MGDKLLTPKSSVTLPTEEELDEALRCAQATLDTELATLRRQVGRGSEQTLAMRIKV